MPVDSDLVPLPITAVSDVDRGELEPGYTIIPTNEIIEESKRALLAHGIVFYNHYYPLNDSYRIRTEDSTPIGEKLGRFLTDRGWLGFSTVWTFAGVRKRARRGRNQHMTIAVPPDPNVMA